MRVLHSVPSLHIGGVARVVFETVGALEAQGVKSIVLSMSDRNDFSERGEVEVMTLGYSSMWSSLATIRRIARIITDRRIDVSHTNLNLDRRLVGMASRRVGIPMVTSLHASDDPLSDDLGPIARTIVHSHNAALRRLPQHYLAVSETVARSQNKRLGLDPRSTTVIGNPIPSGFLQQDPLPPPFDPGYILAVGRLVKAKGHANLVEAMALLRDRGCFVRCLIAGDGELKPLLARKIAELQLAEQVELLGSRSDVRALLQHASVFVFPSTTEGSPMALIEAAATGIPIVASNIEPVLEVVPETLAAFFSPGNASALADQLEKTLVHQDDSRKKALMLQNHVRSARHPDVFGARLQRVYEQVVAGRS